MVATTVADSGAAAAVVEVVMVASLTAFGQASCMGIEAGDIVVEVDGVLIGHNTTTG